MKLEVAQKEKDGIQLTIEKLKNTSKSLNKLIDCQIVENCKKGLGYESYNAVPPPYTGNFMPPKPDLSFIGLDEFAVKPVGNPQIDLHDKGVIDSGCSRHMTGNMSYLIDYEEINRGYVAFGGNPKGGKITRKEAVNTACYVQNRVLVVKPHNKTLYELFHGRTPTLSFMRPFGCPVTILNTKDHLGKFDGSGLDWLFDIDALTRIMNYEPIVLDQKSSHDDGFKPLNNDGKKVDEDPRKVNECNDQEKKYNVNNTNNVNTVSSTVNAAGTNKDNELPFDLNMPALEDVGTFDFLNKDEDDGEMVDMSNLETTIQVNPMPTIRIHKDHPLDQMDVKSAFLYEKIEEEMYVCQPPGFEDPDFLDGVYKVKKALYGLHQAPRAWCETLSTYLLDNGFQIGKINKTFFIKRHKEVKNASTPMETQKPLLKDEDGVEVDVHMYRSMIGLLMYLTSSRPDIMFAVCACARYQFYSKVSHLHAMKRIFSDYAEASLDRKSTTGGCQFLRCRLISWQCKKQTMVANSTTEAEYVAASSCCGQVLWIHNEAVYKELDDRLVRDATTSSSLEAKQDSDNINKTQSKATPNKASSLGTTLGGGPRCQEAIGDTIAQIRFENVSKHSNDSLLATLQSDKDSLKLNKLIKLCTNLQSRVLDLEKTKTTQALKITSLKRRLKKLKKKQRLRTYKLKRLYKGRKIHDIDDDEDITLVNNQDDAEMFDVNDLHGEEVFVEKELADKEVNDDAEMIDVNALHGEEVFVEKELADKEVNDEVQKVVKEVVEDINTAKLILNATQVSAAGKVNAASIATTVSATIIATDEITLAQALMEIKTLKPKAKGVFIQKPSESITTTTKISLKKSQDNGKAITIEEPMKPKKKDQIRIDEEVALNLQAEFDEEEQRHARESAQKEQEANIALIEEWNDIQAKIDADYQLAQRLQAEEQQELTDAKSYIVYAILREEKKVLCSKRKKLKDLKNKSFDSIQKMSDRAFNRQKVNDDKEKVELKELMEIIPDKEEVAIDAIPLAVKSPKIVDWKIHKEGKKSYYQIKRADGNFKMYMVFNRMLKEFDREDLEDL
nr:hypothetical protein [Tanacetum cinerariifolium]